MAVVKLEEMLRDVPQKFIVIADLTVAALTGVLALGLTGCSPRRSGHETQVLVNEKVYFGESQGYKTLITERVTTYSDSRPESYSLSCDLNSADEIMRGICTNREGNIDILFSNKISPDNATEGIIRARSKIRKALSDMKSYTIISERKI